MKIVYILISVALVMAVLEFEPVEANWFTCPRKLKNIKKDLSKSKKALVAAKKNEKIALAAAKKNEKFAKCMLSCFSRRPQFVRAFCAAECKTNFMK